MEKICKESKLTELSRKLDELKDVKGALLPCLQASQETFGYLNIDIMRLIAEKLNLSTEEVYEVASFYSQFKLQEVGLHKVSVCMGTACYVRGANDIFKEIEKILNVKEGETTADGYYTLDSYRCVGCCALAPVILIDEKIYGNVKTSEVKRILDDFKKDNPA